MKTQKRCQQNRTHKNAPKCQHALVLLVSLWGAVSLGQTLKVEGARFRRLPIEIPDPEIAVPNVLAEQMGRDLVRVVRDDLALSTVFAVLDPKSYIGNKPDDATSIGAEALAVVHLTLLGQDLVAELSIYSLKTTKAKGSKTFRVNTTQVTYLAHQISDEIFSYFTGEPGMFNSQIAAAKAIPGGKEIVVLNFDGSNERVVTKTNPINVLPTLEPEGDAVLFTTYKNHNANLMQINLDGTNLKTISAQPGLNTGAQVSPNRKQIAFTISKGTDSEIYLADRNGKDPKKITNSFGINVSPSFSPDGTKVAFVSSRSGNPQIYVMNADGTNPKRLTFQGKYNQTPKFSPKGDVIAFTGRDEKNVFDIFLIDVKSGVVSRVTQDQGNNEDPSFSPNGRLITFTSSRDGKRELYVSSLDGAIQKRITNGGGYFTPSWGPAR